MKKIKLILTLLISLFFTVACGKNFDPNRPISAEEKRKKNIEEGRGASIGGLLGNVGKTNYQFSSSNPMWRASLEILDFLPLTTVDYSGGIIITDWYSEDNSNTSIKISVRFLDNVVRSDSLKIIVHKKGCSTNNNCKINLLDESAIGSELLTAIVKKAAELEISSNNRKK